MKLRSVELTPEDLLAFEELRRSSPRANDFQIGLEWSLARHPEWGNAAPYVSCSIYPVQVGARRFAVYYEYDESKVRLLALRSVPNDPAYFDA